MAVSLVHAFVSSKANSTDSSLVRPVNWNAQHTLTGLANSILGFDGSGNALDGNLFWAAGILAGGTAAGSTLTLESTTGAGSGDFINFKTASQVEALRLDNKQRLTMNTAASGNQFGNLVEFHNTDGTVTTGTVSMTQWNGNRAGLNLNRTNAGTVGSHAILPLGALISAINSQADDGTSFQGAVQSSGTVDAAIATATASGSFTTATTTITLTASNSGNITPGALVYDSTAAATVGTVSTCNGTSLVLTAASLINSSGSSDALQFYQPGGALGRQVFAVGQNNNLNFAAAASFTTASTTITMASNIPPWAVSGTFVYDTTVNSAVGKVSSGAGTTTLTLQAASLINSSGSADNLVFQTASGLLTEVMRFDSVGPGRITTGGVANQTNIAFEVNSSGGTSLGGDGIASVSWGGIPHLNFVKINNNTIGGAATAVNSGNSIGSIQWGAADGTTINVTMASIAGNVDAAVSTGIVPGRLTIRTANTSGSNTERLRIDSSGNAKFTGSIGYSSTAFAGVGGAITQTTSRTTGVTLNTICGAITLVSAAGSTTASTFTVTNSTIAATDVVIINQKSGTDKYEIFITAVAAGSFNVTFFTTGGTTTEQPVFNFAIIKAVAS